MGRYVASIFALGLALFAPGFVAAQEDEYAAIRDKLEGCFACHGDNGASEDALFPIIAGQHLYYLYVQLRDFEAGRRVSPMMTEVVTGRRIEENIATGAEAGGGAVGEGVTGARIQDPAAAASPAGPTEPPVMTDVASRLTKQEMLLMAKFFSEQEWPNIGYGADPEIAKRGETAAVAGQCVQCHRGGYEGDRRIPRLAGQYAAYLEKTMLDFKSKERNNSPAKSSLMNSFSEDDIAAMAAFTAGK